MVAATLEWTTDDVANWLIEAARTAHRLPPVRVQGHFNCWPAIVRSEYERMASDDAPDGIGADSQSGMHRGSKQSICG